MRGAYPNHKLERRLSIIIVNYNVQHFLEQCLLSVKDAIKNIDAEVIVVDNQSVDGSVEMLKSRFDRVKLIESKENLGFSKGNNLAIKEAKADYILLLNPDTLVAQDSFEKCIQFMDDHPDVGGLGVKMIDGKGHFLPESKRSLPTPEVAFYKVFGLSALFPKSKRFGKYHLGYLDENENHEVEVLSGAYMMLRKEALDKIGLLDETFFMYGEDIDLSYRLNLGGYKNYYLADTSIIHYKGESTKKSSVNYVIVFYKAMIIFAKKHFSSQKAGLFSLFIYFAVFFRAGIALMNRFFQKSYAVIIDFIIVFAGLFGITSWYEQYSAQSYPDEVLLFALPLYSITWVIGLWLGGAYDRPYSLRRFILGISIGTIMILSAYGLLSESYRFSRAIILIGAGFTVLSGISFRWLLSVFKLEEFKLFYERKKRFLIVGNASEFERVSHLLSETSIEIEFAGRVESGHKEHHEEESFVGHLDQLLELIKVFRIDEVVFCSQDLESGQIIQRMSLLENSNVDYKIAPPASKFVIGSNSINTTGELYSVKHLNNISKAGNKRLKRLFDLSVCFISLLLSPMLIFIQKRPLGFIGNILQVAFGLKTWVGFSNPKDPNLPKLKPGVIKAGGRDEEHSLQKDIIYAKNYAPQKDLKLINSELRNLGS